MAGFPKDFLWGGAVAAHQLEELGRKMVKERVLQT